MEYIIKVNVNSIESKGKKFDVYNTYIRHPENNDWVKFNVRFGKDSEKPTQTSNCYVDKDNISISEIGNYPTIYIKKVNKISKILFDKKNLDKYFKKAEQNEEKENDVMESPFSEEKEINTEALPF